MSRPRFCEVREDFLNSTFKMAEDFKAAKKTIASLERQLAEVRGERDRLRHDLVEADRQAAKVEALLDPHVSWEGKPPVAQTTTEAERDRLAARCGGAETLLRAFLNAEYESKDYLFDCVDKTGRPYQSQWLADRIAETERFLATGTRAALQEPQI